MDIVSRDEWEDAPPTNWTKTPDHVWGPPIWVCVQIWEGGGGALDLFVEVKGLGKCLDWVDLADID